MSKYEKKLLLKQMNLRKLGVILQFGGAALNQAGWSYSILRDSFSLIESEAPRVVRKDCSLLR